MKWGEYLKKTLILLRNRFFAGVFVVLPIGITVWVIFKVFMFLDSLLGATIYKLIGRKIYGLGLIITIAIIVLIGMIASNVVGKEITILIGRLFENLPIVKTIYTPVKDILSNFSDKTSNNFKKAVLVTYPSQGLQSIGFITKENVLVDGELKTVVFIPTTPNPTSGFLIYLTKDRYFELDIPIDDALKAIISLGSVSPSKIIRKTEAGSEPVNSEKPIITPPKQEWVEHQDLKLSQEMRRDYEARQKALEQQINQLMGNNQPQEEGKIRDMVRGITGQEETEIEKIINRIVK